MKLFIDTSSKDKLIVGFDEQKYEVEAKQDASQRLLPFILEHLKKEGRQLQAITSIEVATGPGSFTGLRVGVSVAQTLGWALDVPVNGENMREAKFIPINY